MFACLCFNFIYAILAPIALPNVPAMKRSLFCILSQGFFTLNLGSFSWSFRGLRGRGLLYSISLWCLLRMELWLRDILKQLTVNLMAVFCIHWVFCGDISDVNCNYMWFLSWVLAVNRSMGVSWGSKRGGLGPIPFLPLPPSKQGGEVRGRGKG